MTCFVPQPEQPSPLGTDAADSPGSYGASSSGYYQQSLSPDSVNIGSPVYQQVSALGRCMWKSSINCLIRETKTALFERVLISRKTA